jgi:hypothetical protein
MCSVIHNQKVYVIQNSHSIHPWTKDVYISLETIKIKEDREWSDYTYVIEPSKWMYISLPSDKQILCDGFAGHIIVMDEEWHKKKNQSHLFQTVCKARSITFGRENIYYEPNLIRYVTFPEGVTYRGKYYPSNGVWYSDNVLEVRNLKANFVCYQSRVSSYPDIINTSKFNNVISTKSHATEYEKFAHTLEKPKRKIKRLQTLKKVEMWKIDAVLFMLSADLYEDDEYTWK